MTDKINEFKGDYRFLSNFWVEMDGSTAEHRFQALKTLDPDEQVEVLTAPTPGQAKRLGRKVTLRADWEKTKLKTMVMVVTEKFVADPELMQKLLDTGDAELIEGNTWGDTFWGVDLESGQGQNVLGQILMALRAEVRVDMERELASKRLHEQERQTEESENETPTD